jgi:pyruvate dehydrogenase E2 component (dihydrolipoamide acetyltransferase)
MPIEILMPALSPTMTSGSLTKWHKKEGDIVKSGEILAEVETDKATMEVEAVDEGKLARILVAEQSHDVEVNSVIAILLEEGEDEAALNNFKTQNQAPAAKVIEVPKSEAVIPDPRSTIEAKNDGKVFISPLAKRIANQNGVDIKNINGSGPNGRIIKTDVLNLISNKPSEAKHVTNEEHVLHPHTVMRKVIANRLLESKQTIPHFYLTIECKIDSLITLREQINKDADKKISINDFIIKAVALTLKQMPEVNSSWSGEGIKKYTNVDVSVAVSVDQGLITPIIKKADTKTLSNISMEMKDLAARAKENKLRPEEFQGGGFTISNLGMFGIKQFCAIINPPQSCILAIGTTTKKPVVNGEKIEIASIMDVTLSCDHRVVDGVLGANFLNVFKNYLENPVRILV